MVLEVGVLQSDESEKLQWQFETKQNPTLIHDGYRILIPRSFGEFPINLGLRPQTKTRPKVAQNGDAAPDNLFGRYRTFRDYSVRGTRSIGKISSLSFQRIKERLNPTPYEKAMPVVMKGDLLKPNRIQGLKWIPN